MEETEEHEEILGHMMVTAAKVARENNVEGYRIILNTGKHGGRMVTNENNFFLDVIGGQQLTWPPFKTPKPAET